MTVSEFYPNLDEFRETLIRAEENAKNAWEEEFVEGLRAKFDQYGGEMFLSDKQQEKLEAIAEGDDR